MKRILSITVSLVALFIAVSAFTPLAQQNEDQPHIQFKETKYNYGKMEKGDDGTHIFVFTNTGRSPLIINNVKSSCGCTVADKPTQPIMPGKSDSIKVRYNTSRVGAFRKTITIFSNADNNQVVLQISGEVVPKPQEEMPVKPQGGFTPVAR